MSKKNCLRSQIVYERRRKTRLVIILFTFATIFVGFNLLVDDMGVVKYYELKNEEKVISRNIATIEMEIASLHKEIAVITQDPFYIEKQAREDLGLAKPDEYIFKYEK